MNADAPSLRIAPPPFLGEPGLAAIMAALPGARVVGGAVRDVLAGRDVADVDLGTPEEPEQAAALLRTAGLRVIPTGIEHGTVTAMADGRGYEVTTLRRDVATDGRHAVVAFTTDWREDAARRDFSLNALSMRRDGAVFDYFGGIEDLRAGRVRFVGDPAARISEDYLRILRFFRFQARYGRVAPDAATLAAIRAGVPGMAKLSAERVWGELRRILAGPVAGRTLALMDSLGVLGAVLPEGADPARLDPALPADPILRLAAITRGDPDALAARLRLSNPERARLAELGSGPTPRPEDDDASLRRLLADIEPPLLEGRAWLAGGADPAWAELRARLAGMVRPVFPLAGRDVLSLGIAPGPHVGALLGAVRQWWLEDGCVADAAACMARLEEAIASDG